MPLAVCATPIGNLDDVTLRVLARARARPTSSSARTRGTRASCSSGTGSRRGASQLPRAQRGGADRRAAAAARGAGSGWRSSATPGLPGVSDPGARLVAAALDAGVPVTVLPGPVGGRDGARRERLRRRAVPVPRLSCRGGRRRSRALWDELARVAVAGGRVRVAAAPAGVAAVAGAGAPRPAAWRVCRELTKRFEEVVRGPAAELAERFAEPPKGEITLVLGAGGGRSADDDAGARRPWPSSSRRARRAGRPPTSSRG